MENAKSQNFGQIKNSRRGANLVDLETILFFHRNFVQKNGRKDDLLVR